jgi:hypothetical protein
LKGRTEAFWGIDIDKYPPLSAFMKKAKAGDAELRRRAQAAYADFEGGAPNVQKASGGASPGHASPSKRRCTFDSTHIDGSCLADCSPDCRLTCVRESTV